MNFVCIVFELGDKMLTLSSMENLIVQCNHVHCCRMYTNIVIYTTVFQEPNRLYILLSGAYIKLFFTRQPFKSKFKINSGLLGVHIQCLFT